MAAISLPAPQDIRNVVEEEISLADGNVTDCVIHNDRLFLRSVLPQVRQVRRKDSVQAGVAVMASRTDIFVHPYTFRQVCRNGAVMSQTLDSVQIERVPLDAPSDVVENVLVEVREAVRRCTAPEVFSNVVDRLMTAADTRASVVLQVLMAAPHSSLVAHMLDSIVGDRSLDRDPTAYGLMNAITRAARDEPDPQVRWELEELGGGIPAMLSPSPQPDSAAESLLVT
jgi:hypothetical protein